MPWGGEFVPLPPLNAINYANDPMRMAAKLRQLTPELKAGVDEGFSYVSQIKSLYDSSPSNAGDDPKVILVGHSFSWCRPSTARSRLYRHC